MKPKSAQVGEQLEKSAHNRHIEMTLSRNKKYKNYALFQFFSVMTIFLLGLSLGLTIYIAVKNKTVDDYDFFDKAIISMLTFDDKHSLNIFVAIIAYGSFVSWGVSIWIATWQFKNKHRSIFDAVFLLFFFVPLLSNVIALFCQVSEVVYKTPNEFVDQYKTKIDYLHELELYVKKEYELIGKKSNSGKSK